MARIKMHSSWENEFTNGGTIPKIYAIESVSLDSDYDLSINKEDDKEDKTYYLLSVIYSTGDSYGKSTDFVSEYIELYNEHKEAMENANKITKRIFSHSKEKLEKLEITGSDGKKLRAYQHCPWEGYFERVEAVLVSPVKFISPIIDHQVDVLQQTFKNLLKRK